jgi:uncharacterized protein DUF5681
VTSDPEDSSPPDSSIGSSMDGGMGAGPEDMDEPAIGHAGPPHHSRLRKGQSGNRRVRPRRARDLAGLLSALLDTPAIIVEDGKRRRGTKRELIATQLVDRSAQADLRATKLLVDLLQKIAPRLPEPEHLEEADEKVVATLLARLGMAE